MENCLATPKFVFPGPPGASSQVWTYGEEHHHAGSRGTDGCPRWGAYAAPESPNSCSIQESCEDSLVIGGENSISIRAITAGGTYGDWRCHPELAREFNSNEPLAWCNDNNNVDSGTWLQYDFGTLRHITAVSTQARPGYNQYVTTYNLKGWRDSAWVTVGNEGGTPIIFPGNSDLTGIVRNKLPQWFYASKIRIYPLTFVRHISVRFDVFGC